ncbi:MAG: hypothetical protein IT310_12635 [Anaerolineales bacterium]|nr:hypothetical protein [Anaerolineales bacterium]
MNEKLYRDILDSAAGDSLSRNTNLWPKISAQVEKKSFMLSLRLRPMVLLLIAVLVLLALSGAVYAIGQSLGYIPGIGLVDQNAPLRILAEPVGLTRDGVTVKVEEAVISADKTVIKFSMEGVSQYANPQDLTKCDDRSTGMSLPDGSHLNMIAGYGLDGWASGYEARYTFDPVPSGVNDATFIPPCLQGYMPNANPEDWKLALHFIPAPSQMTVMPVIEVTPSLQAANQNPLTLEKVIETDNGYILAGAFNLPNLPPNEKVLQFGQPPSITDASGQDVPFTFADYKLDLPAEKTPAGGFLWAFDLDGKQFDWPLTITVNSVAVQFSGAQAQFEFDAGPNSTDGQIWENLNIHFELAGHPVQALNVIRTPAGYQFNFVSDDSTVFNSVDISIGDSMQGLTGMNGLDSFGSEAKFAGAVPSGRMTVLLSHPVILESGNWQTQWKPERDPTLSTPTAASQSAPQTCLTADSWKAAFANPQPIPTDLPGRIFLQPKLDDPNPAIYVANPDGSNKQEVGRGWKFQFVSTSPDGAQALFSQEDGLYIMNLATGDKRRIPDSLPGDFGALWSPGGTRIAFLRVESPTSYPSIYMINADGTGLQKATDETGDYYLRGWLPDDSALFFAELTRAGYTLKKLELSSGTISDFFAPKGGNVDAITPDGKGVVFSERIDETNQGLYIAHLDGSNRRLIASASLSSESWSFGQTKLSPDGKWLAIVIYATTANQTDESVTLLNLATCQIVPLSYKDNLLAWTP